MSQFDAEMAFQPLVALAAQSHTRIESDFSGHMVKETISDNVWPDDLAVDDEGNVWIAELNGKVHRYDNETGETKLIAELPTTDPKNIEHGLYGIAPGLILIAKAETAEPVQSP